MKKIKIIVLSVSVIIVCAAIFLFYPRSNGFYESQIENYVCDVLQKTPDEITTDDLASIDNLYLNGISSIKDLRKFGGLTSLSISDSSVDKWDTLYAAHLQSLELVNNTGTVDMAKIDKSALESISVSGNVENLDSLKDAKNLKSLIIWDCSEQDFSFLSELSSLTFLEAVNCGIEDISFVNNMPGLISLDLSNNLISDISPLKSKQGISSLDLGHNKLTDISALGNIIDLQNLNLSQNRISDLTALKNLTGIIMLNISDNSLSDISPLSTLRFLESLDISYNHITSLTPIEGLESISEVDAQSNMITSVPPKIAKRVYYMDLSSNLITVRNASFFIWLEQNKNEGANINLFDNPFSDSDITELDKIECVVFQCDEDDVSADEFRLFNKRMRAVTNAAEGSTQSEKAQSVYKYITSSFTALSEDSETERGLYNAVVNGKGTSYDMSLAYSSALRRIGIESEIYRGGMFGSDSPHYWNIVCADGGKSYFDTYCGLKNIMNDFSNSDDFEMTQNDHILLSYYCGAIQKNTD